MIADQIALRQGMSVAEFAAAYDSGALSLNVAGDFTVALEGQPWTRHDPHSAAYHDWVIDTWKAISGRTAYSPDIDEVFDVSAESFLAHPYPYNTGNGNAVGQYTGAIAWMMRTLQIRGSQRVIEFGAGWGHLAIALAMLGCDTTAVDLNPSSVALLTARAKGWKIPLNVVRSSFLGFEPKDSYDLVVYFEAFHHCDQPLALLDRSVAMLAPGGSIVFIADAIYDGFYCPWGVRLDGHATYMSRHAGWLELGFEREFFYAELRRRGLKVETFLEPSLGAYGTLIVASR
jgi:SAM-dependent methyltransferase